MKIRSLPLLAVALLAIGAVASHAQTYQVATAFNCGRLSSPLYCYGVPLTLDGAPAGTFWLDTYVSGSNAGSGFVVWYGVGTLADAIVTGNVPTYETVTSNGRTINAVTHLTVDLKGDSTAGVPYTGTMTLTFSYYYSSGGGGRGGAGSGWRWVVTGGTISIQ